MLLFEENFNVGATSSREEKSFILLVGFAGSRRRNCPRTRTSEPARGLASALRYCVYRSNVQVLLDHGVSSWGRSYGLHLLP